MIAIILRPMTDTPEKWPVRVYFTDPANISRTICGESSMRGTFIGLLEIGALGWCDHYAAPEPVVTATRLEELLASERTGLQNFGVMDVLRQLIEEAKERANV